MEELKKIKFGNIYLKIGIYIINLKSMTNLHKNCRKLN